MLGIVAYLILKYNNHYERQNVMIQCLSDVEERGFGTRLILVGKKEFTKINAAVANVPGRALSIQ